MHSRLSTIDSVRSLRAWSMLRVFLPFSTANLASVLSEAKGKSPLNTIHTDTLVTCCTHTLIRLFACAFRLYDDRYANCDWSNDLNRTIHDRLLSLCATCEYMQMGSLICMYVYSRYRSSDVQYRVRQYRAAQFDLNSIRNFRQSIYQFQLYVAAVYNDANTYILISIEYEWFFDFVCFIFAWIEMTMKKNIILRFKRGKLH